MRYPYLKMLLFPALLVASAPVFSQTSTVSGSFVDEGDNSPLSGVTVLLVEQPDTAKISGMMTDENGAFRFTGVKPGNYRLRATYIGYKKLEMNLLVTLPEVSTGVLKMGTDAKVFGDIIVVEKETRVEQKGDTIQFNANAYKTNPDANAEDLVTKMPGVTNENGTLKVGGEDVKKILVDGKPFFGDDPAMAMKNLPAEVIDKIQVFDQSSDQSQFTGFDDGNASKTINIITKPGKNNGQFGKIYAGYGPDNRYIAGGNVNFFKGTQRISLIGLSNNINQQNFSTEDILGVVGTSGNTGGQPGGGRGGRGGSGGGSPGGGNNANNFLVGNQGGIAKTHAFGINYSDEWRKKIKVSGSYFLNFSDREQVSTLNRNFILPTDSGLFYRENSFSGNKNTNHRLNFRFEYTIDSFNSLIIVPRVSLQQNNARSSLLGSNVNGFGSLENRTDNQNNADNIGYNLSNNILYRHKFRKEGRTISWNIRTELNNKYRESSLRSFNEYFNPPDSITLDQQANQNTESYTLGTTIAYTEPLSKNAQIQVNYEPTYTRSITDKETNNRNSVTEQYSELDTTLSNNFENIYLTNKAGASYRYNKNKIRLSFGADVQMATLSGQQIFPGSFTIKKDFFNVLPSAAFNYKKSESENIRFNYRTSTRPPAVNQLQEVVDNSNPLFLSSGNPNLKQSFSHRLMGNYGKTNTKKATSFFFFLMGNYEQNYIGNSTLVAARDTTLGDGTLLPRGSQFTRPVNLDGYWNVRSFVTFGSPIKKLKSNINLNTGFVYSRTPALINNTPNISSNYTFSEGIVLGSNISENLDFNIAYTANYSIVRNELQPQANNNYFFQVTSAKINWIFAKRFVVNTNLNHTLYTGLSQSFNQSFLLWNASFGYKLLKDQRLEAKVTVYDILNQNNSINRNVTETYIEDVTTNVLNRYFMLVLTYNLKNFKK